MRQIEPSAIALQDRLKLIPPRTPPAIIATLKENYSPPNNAAIGKISVSAKSTNTAAGLVCNVSWQAANDLGVAYTLIRKIDGEPKTYRDGEILVENTDKLEFTDNDVLPGILYGYAVFSTRLGTTSPPKTTTAVHYSDLDEKKLIFGDCRRKLV